MQVSNTKNAKKSEWESLGDIDAKGKMPTGEYSSVCDIWKDSVHKVITKMEYHTPIYLQAYSQMHSEFLHSIDNSFGTCYIWQKRYFDRMGFDQKAINAYEKLCDSATGSAMEWMDVYANYKRFESDLAIQYMKIGNSCLRWWVDMFGKTMASWKF
ncbi:MAG: hypothetical protein EPO62_04490 [Candidatus Nitrosotenuis sp.]|nr:MAG: hypothetical protein EPO62_04490 [Candidatus Nitrosotenuis sp.]